MKRLLSSIRIAFRALAMNKLRSALTMLGIVIGVASVIATVAVGSGATQRIQEQIASIGSNIIMVLPGSTTSSGLRLGSGNAVTLTQTDAKELLAQCPALALAAPTVRGSAQVVNGNNNWATVIYGITPDYLTVRQLSVADGDEISQQDVDGAAKVALLGKTVATNLFGGADPVGQTIRIKQVPFTVAGVLTPKGQSSSGQDQDDVILLPITTAVRKVIGVKQANADAVDNIIMQAKSPARCKRHRTRPRDCSGSAIIFNRPKRTTSRSGIWKRSLLRRRRLPRSCRSCWEQWLRCRWLWEALAS